MTTTFDTTIDPDQLLEVTWKYLPRDVSGPCEFDDPDVVLPALIARCATIVESVYLLDLPRHIAEVEEQARSMLEAAIFFAWLASGPGDRWKMWIKDEWIERIKIDNQVTDFKKTKAYKGVESIKNLPDSMLDPPARAIAEEWSDDKSIFDLPGVATLAIEADKDWMPKIEILKMYPFRYWYEIIYRGYSAVSHPTPRATYRYVKTLPGGVVCTGVPGQMNGLTNPLTLIIGLFHIVLEIANQVLGWPTNDEIVEVSKAQILYK